MKIQAINNTANCQPIRNVGFGHKHKAPVIIETPIFISASVPKEDKQSDIFVPPATAEQKYNFACLLAAYYKTQYENLLKNGCCEA